MLRKITFIPLFLLILIVLLGICKPAGDDSKSSHTYQISLPAAPQPVNSSDQFIVLPSSDKTIVHAVHFNFAQEFLFVLGLAFSILLLFAVYIFQAPAFTNSYFTNTFCHLIAINAP